MKLIAGMKLRYALNRILTLENNNITMETNKFNTLMYELHDSVLYLKELYNIIELAKLKQKIYYNASEIEADDVRIYENFIARYMHVGEELFSQIYSNKLLGYVPKVFKWAGAIIDSQLIEVIGKMDMTVLRRTITSRNECQSKSLDDQFLCVDSIKLLGRSIVANNPQRKRLNVLDPSCKTGVVLTHFTKDHIMRYETYGINPNHHAFHHYAKTYLSHAIKGTGVGHMISNNAFDILVSIPDLRFAPNPYDVMQKMYSEEKEQIQNSLRCLREDGLMILSIPFYRLTYTLIRLIAKNFKEVRAFAIEPYSMIKNDGAEDIVMILRKGEVSNDRDDIEKELLRYIDYYYYTDVKLMNKRQDTMVDIKLPDDEIDINIFRGSVFDEDDILDLLNQSDLYDEVLNKKSHEDSLDSAPLLPFSIGQVGLVLTSGELDGVVTDEDNTKHVIRGSVRRNTAKTVTVEQEKGEIHHKETTSHQVQISLFTADGEYKELN